jgi:very-short-patch-repair endonuclease
MTTIDGIPVTTPARTLLDLAAVCSNTRVEEALGEALCRGLVSIPRLRWRSAALGRRPGVEMVRELLDARAGAGVPQSVFETRMLRALKRAGLPLPEMQHPVLQAHAVLDFAYPEVLVAIETEGYRWHSGRARWDRDLARRNRLTELGWRVIHVTWQQLSEQPESLIASISATLAETTSNRSAGRL